MIRTRVLEWIKRHALLPETGRIVAACSGGPDSLALVDLLDGMREELNFNLHVAHLDHGLRGEESKQDAIFVRDFCMRRGLKYFGGWVDVAAEVKARGGSVEETGRRLRYEYLRQVARQLGGAFIATGHHQDDQAETVLLNLLWGSGAKGLGGMRPRLGDVIRPLLCLTRKEIELWCSRQNLLPRIDSSNIDNNFRRNRVRHELMPLLRSDYNFALTETLCRTAEILTDEHDFICACAENILPKLAKEDAAGFRLDFSIFTELPAALQRVAIRRLLEKLQGDVRGLGLLHVEKIRELFLSGEGTKQLDMAGGLKAERCYRDLYIGLRKGVKKRSLPERAELQCPGETRLTTRGLLVRCTAGDEQARTLPAMNANRAIFDQALINFPLQLRCRLPGDRFYPLGAPGERKLKELLIDLKVPVDQRDQIPLIFDSQGILWVVGYRRSERARMSNETKSYIIIEVMPLMEGELQEMV